IPFLRSSTTACSRSPLASVRACLQSIIGAPVFSRSSFTWVAEIFTVVVLIKIVFGRQSSVVGANYEFEGQAEDRRLKTALQTCSTNVDPRQTTARVRFSVQESGLG